MAEQNLNFAKIVANPSLYAWSQAYNAGKLFAVLSLEREIEGEEKDYLNVLGKEILDTLEQEFFTLEKKDLESIKEAVLETSKKIPQEISVSFVIAAFSENILYLYIVGGGKVSIKRDGKLGTLIESEDKDSSSLKVVSGFLEDLDTVVLQTKQLAKIISSDTLSKHLDNLPPAEASENLAPLVHEKEEAGAAAIIISYKKDEEKEEEEILKEDVLEEAGVEEENEKNEEQPFYSSKIKEARSFSIRPLASSFLSRFKLKRNMEFNHPRKVILSIVLIIVVVFLGSVFLALKKQEAAKTKAVFQSFYPAALKNYDEGQALLTLNEGLARDDLSKAKSLLIEGKDKLPKNSTEEKQTLDLLSKVSSALGSTPATSNTAKQIDNSESFYLSQVLKNKSSIYFTQDDKNVYFITLTGVSEVPLGLSTAKTIIKNNGDWTSIGGLATYNGNVYILDKSQNQILKFLKTDSGFEKSDYLASSESPDFQKANAITIDNNIYALYTNGDIAKYFKGQEQTFSLKGLDKPLSAPKKIYTTPDFDNIYILDTNNSRIVVVDKTGSFKTQYSSPVIKNAADFEVLEKDKKIFVLSGGKVYEIDLK